MKVKELAAMLVLQIVLLPAANHVNAQAAPATDSIKPFELRMVNSDYNLTYFIKTLLTNKKLTISVSSGKMDEMDSVLFSENLPASEALRQIRDIHFEALKKTYSNDCLEDGLQITVSIKKDGKKKSVHISNYYQEDIGKLIELINSITPPKYKTWYNKDKLIADYKRCKGSK